MNHAVVIIITFIIARHQYDVELTIRVALRMKCGEQIKNSFWHEVFHAFNFYYNNRQDESFSTNIRQLLCVNLNLHENELYCSF